MKLVKFLATALTLIISLHAFVLQAHEVRPSYLELKQQTTDTFSVLWKVPAKGENLRLGLYVNFAENVEHIGTPVEMFIGGSYVKKWQVKHADALVNTRILIDGLHSTFTEALIRIERLDGSVQVARLMPESPSLIVVESPSSFQVAKTYSGLGIKHILLGFDHLLFLACLLIIAGNFKRILITVTGFTLAHSVTLVLSALGIVKLAIGPVEAIIALSIVFLATEIYKGKRDSLTWKYPVTVSTSFGLLHGFGFAAVLNEIGLPQTELVTGLLFFNIGVEIGQLIFVVAAVLLFKLLTLLNMKMNVDINKAVLQKSLAYGVGSLASFWLIERSVEFLI